MAVGTPPPSFLPARPHKHSYLTEPQAVSVPTRGEFPEDSGFKGEFDISPAEGVVLMGTLTQVMFAYRAYPNLEDTQRFVLLGVEVQDDKTVVIGRVAEFEE